MSEPTYPLAPNAVFATVQGEGALSGLPMAFVRLGGCSVGCPECDTDYRVSGRATAAEIADRIGRVLYGGVEWLWITGGEPTDHDLRPIIEAGHDLGLKVAVATAGTRPVPLGWAKGNADFVSVSPHRLDESWVQRRGDQLVIVPGLNGLRLSDLAPLLRRNDAWGFPRKYVTPLADREGRPVNLRECVEFVQTHKGWRLNAQAHKLWGVP